MKAFRKGTSVQWKWAGGKISGKIEEVFKKSITKTIKGSKITRHGTAEKPTYLVRSKAGNIALKLHSELTEITKDKSVSRPQFDDSKLKD